MKTILVFVSTVDGKITKWGDHKVRLWSSTEDKEYFSQLWNDSNLIVMGSNTFKSEPFKLLPGKLRVVMTSNPALYESKQVTGQLEFTKASPGELSFRYQNEGYQQMIVVGGPHMATSFLKLQLIDELWLTLEPKIFGSGGNLVIEDKLDINLKLISCNVVNEKGTMIIKYSVQKTKE